jgi:hypothetical protein
MDTVDTACAVQAPVPEITVYVVVDPGVTVTVWAEAGLVPELANQLKGPGPLAESVALCPKQMDVRDGVIAIVDGGPTFTVATAVAVQLPEPDNTVYVVVEAGVTVTLAALVGLAPLLAVHVNGPAPLEDKAWLCPLQIVETDGVMLIEGVVEIETVAIAELVQVPAPETTVKDVVVAGVTVTVAAAGGLAPLLAVQVNGPVPLALNTWLCPAQMLVIEGVIAVVGVADTETVITVELTQDPTVFVTV